MTIVLEAVTIAGRIRTRRNASPPRPLDQAGRKLAQGCIPLAAAQARRFVRRRPMNLSEAIAVALYGVTEAAARYEEGRGVPFAAYATLVVRSKLHEAADRHYQHADHTVRHAEEQEPQLADAHEAEPSQAAEVKEIVARLRCTLDRATFALLWEAFAQDKSLTDIARERGVSKQAISQAVQAAIQRARRAVPGLAQQ